MLWRRTTAWLWLILLAGAAQAGTYHLSDGRTVTGEPRIFNEYVQLKLADGTFPHFTWDKFPQEALTQLLADTKDARDRQLIEALMVRPKRARAAKPELPVLQPLPAPPHPSGSIGLAAIFASPIGWCLLAMIYGATLWAAHEVALYKNHYSSTVCGLAAIPVIGVLSPIVFLMLPPSAAARVSSVPPMPSPDPSPDPAPAQDQALPALPAPSPAASAPLLPAAPQAPPPPPVPPPSEPAELIITAQHTPGPVPSTVKLRSSRGAPPTPTPSAAPLPVPSIYPQPVVFTKADFTFNRRFFETKLAGFFRLIPGDAEKEMVLYIQAMRGQFVGKRITNISPTDLHLLIFRSAASAEEVIPLIEIQEVQIRHQDTV